MRIAVVTKELAAGGAERVIAQLLNEWSGMGHECHLILLDKTPRFYGVSDAVDVLEIGELSDTFYVDKLLKYARVRKLVRGIKPDVVLSMPEEYGIFVIGALLGTGIPTVVSERNDPRRMPFKKATRALRRMLYPFAKGLIFQTEHAKSYFPKRFYKKSIVLDNPLDLNRLPEPHTGERDRFIAAVGRLEKQKNYPVLLDAFSKFFLTHPDFRLVIYGQGGLEDELKAYARSILPAEAVEFGGVVKDVLERINSASCFVLSSDHEGVPNALIEAMALGIPCVSTDFAPCGASCVIEDKKTGYITPVGDADKLCEAMCLAVDLPDRLLPAETVSRMIREKYDAKAVSLRWLEFLGKTSSK